MPGRALLIRALLPGAIVLAVALSGCGSAGTPVVAPTPSGAAAAACNELKNSLPTTVAGQSSRPVLPPSPYAAAWGDPAIVLRCGVDPPTTLDPTAQLFTINGIDWYPTRSSEATTFTTVGRAATVVVTVPATYAPEAAVLTDLASAIKAVAPTPSAT